MQRIVFCNISVYSWLDYVLSSLLRFTTPTKQLYNWNNSSNLIQHRYILSSLWTPSKIHLSIFFQNTWESKYNVHGPLNKVKIERGKKRSRTNRKWKHMETRTQQENSNYCELLCNHFEEFKETIAPEWRNCGVTPLEE